MLELATVIFIVMQKNVWVLNNYATFQTTVRFRKLIMEFEVQAKTNNANDIDIFLPVESLDKAFEVAEQ